MYEHIKELELEIQKESEKIQEIKKEIKKAVVGQDYMIERLLIGLLTGGHILVEGLPGLAKTLAVNSLAKTVNADFKRIQFTPDMLPADLTGTNVFNPKDGTFSPRKGPIFSNIILADEINRAPAKVQSALLEVMQEQQVTLGGETFKLESPFLVLATQNPLEQEGTYPLPEAQIDRFMMKLKISYPTKEDEREIIDRITSFKKSYNLKPILNKEEVAKQKELIESVYLDDKIKDYIVDLIDATRNPDKYNLSSLKSLIEVGASPRATIALAIASKAMAFISGKGFVSPQHVKIIAPDILRHRIIISYEAEAEEKTSDDLIQTLLSEVPVP